MKPEDFDYICRMLRDRSGLVLSKDKGYLLESRLTPVAQRHELAGLDALIAKLRAGGNEALCIEVTEAMTTNESFFFRDEHVFTGFRDNILPAIMEARAAKRQFRIWCAAASSGQEPYTLAMLLKEASAKLGGWKYEIIGTDISNDILDRAKEGIYSQFEVQRGLPVQLLVKYFEKSDQMWQISPEIKSVVRYEEFNLLDDMTKLGSFDIVFCRNVLIYFDQETKTQILARIANLMPADGTLILGGAETVVGISDHFAPKREQRGVYCKTGAEEMPPVVGLKPAPAAVPASPAPAAATPTLTPKSGLATVPTRPPKPAAPSPAAAIPAPRPAAPAPTPVSAAPRPVTPAASPAAPAPRPAVTEPSPVAAPTQPGSATAALAAKMAANKLSASTAPARPAVPTPTTVKPAPAPGADAPAKSGTAPSGGSPGTTSSIGART